MIEKATYPTVCRSEFCGNISCDGCKHKPLHDAYMDAYIAANQAGVKVEFGATVMTFHGVHNFYRG